MQFEARVWLATKLYDIVYLGAQRVSKQLAPLWCVNRTLREQTNEATNLSADRQGNVTTV